MRSLPRLLPFLFATLLLADNPPAEMTISDGGLRDDPKGPVFWVVVESNLPQGACITLEAALDQTKLDARNRGYVTNTGKVTLTLGPFDKPLLPANYTVSAIVYPEAGQQDMGLSSYFSTWKAPLVQTQKIRFGTDADEKAARKKEDEALLDWLKKAEALQEEAVQSGDLYRQKKMWHTPSDGNGRFDSKAFLTWADDALGRLWALDDTRAEYFNACAATFRQHLWQVSLPELFTALRLIVIDYLIVPVCKRERLDAPAKAKTLDAFFKPPRDSCIEKNRGMFKEVNRALGVYQTAVPFEKLPLPMEKLPAGYGLAHLPDKVAAALQDNPFSAAPPSQTAASAFSDWFGAGPIADETLGEYCLFLSQGSTATKWGDPKALPPDLTKFAPHVAVYAFDFASENGLKNFLMRCRAIKKDGRNCVIVRKEFAVVVIDQLDEKGADAMGPLKDHYEALLQTASE